MRSSLDRKIQRDVHATSIGSPAVAAVDGSSWLRVKRRMLVNLKVQTARNKHRAFVFNAKLDGADKALCSIFEQDE